MGNILQARVRVQGLRPILFHRFGPDALPLEKQERTGVAGNDPLEWKRTVSMTTSRQLYLDGSNIFGMCRDGAKYTKKGKGSIQTSLCATLQIMDDVILLDRFVPEEPITTDPTEPVYMDIRSVRNPTTKARNVRYRIAASSGWSTTFNLLWDKTIVSRGEMQSVMNDAGQLIGLGDARSIGFGRFRVLSFDVNDG
jgi:hypothetical protein